jgi:type I restriction enzyme S subunit
MEEGRELPVGWSEATIQDISVKVGSGATPKGGEAAYKASGIPLIRSTNVVFFGFKQAGLAFIDAQQAEALNNASVKRGDVLLNITGASIGRVTTTPEWADGARVNQHVCIIRPSEGVNANYLGAYLSSPEFQAYVWSDNFGVTRQALTKQQILEVSLPLPPQGEQRRIAAKLDTTLAAVDACRQRLDGVEALLKRFRQAVLAAATSGELTREWRDGVDPSYEQLSFRDLVVDSRTGLVRSSQEQHEPLPGLVPYLKMDAIGEAWGCSYQGYKSVQTTKAELATYELRLGDWLFNTRNSLELVGKSCVWEGPAKVVYNNNILRVRFSSSVSPYWIEIFFRSPMGRELLFGVKSATTSVAAIYQRSLMALPVLVPSIDEQREIIDRVESLFSLDDQLEARLTAARKTVERLTPALLAKAFRGELVPQDPGDEPASALLERIRAARQAEAAASGPSRRGRRQAAANPAPGPVDAAPVTPDRLATLLRECGALSERALLAASELDPASFQAQLAHERHLGAIGHVVDDGQELLEAVG